MIAYYVHHHGTGHVRRAAAVASEIDVPVIGLSSLGPPAGWNGQWLRLSDDAKGVDPGSADVTAGGTLHWAPRRHPGLRERIGAISALLADGRIDCLVSDVSVEVAVLARLHGVPVVVMAQPGERTDRPHRLAFDMADRLLAPWPAHPPRPWPESWLAKTVHLGGFSRYDGLRPPERPPLEQRRERGRRVLVFWGSGGVDVTEQSICAAAAATPDWEWRVAGPAPLGSASTTAPPNLARLGWVVDPWAELCQADVVITHAGQNAVAEVAAARRPAVVIAQHRPFGEQEATADALRDAGLALVIAVWPDAAAWPALLEKTTQRNGDDWTRWSSGDGARRAAQEIETLVGDRVR